MMASAMNHEELMKHYSDKIKALELQMAKTQKEAKSYDLRSGSRPVIPVRNLNENHLMRGGPAPRRASEKEDEEVSASHRGKRPPGMEQVPKKNQRMGARSPSGARDRSPNNRSHVSIGLFEDVEPEELNEEEVIWSNQSQLMSTPYADWTEGRSDSGEHSNQRRKEILRKQKEQEKRPSSPDGLAWWEEAAPAPTRQKTSMVAGKEKNLSTSDRRGQLPRDYSGAERSKKMKLMM